MSTTTAPRLATRRALGLAVEHGVDDFYQGVVPALVPLLVLTRHYDYTRAGGIVLAATVLSSVAQPLFGMLADRRHLPWLRGAGLLLAAVGIGAVGLTQTYPASWTAVLLSGLGVAAFHPEAARAVHATHGGDRAMGWFIFGGLAGFALGAPVASLVLAGLGLAATPLLTVPALVVVATTALRAHQRPADTGGPAGHPATRPAEQVEDRRRFTWLTAVTVLRSVLYYGLTTFLAVYLTTQRHTTPATAAVAISALTGIGALSTLVSGTVSARLGRPGTLLACYLAAAVALAAFLLTPSAVLLVVFAAVLGAALNLPIPVHTTLGQSYLPHHVGLAAAVTLGLAASTGGIAAPLLGILADHHGITTVLTGLLALPLLAALLTGPLLRRRPGPPATNPHPDHRPP